MAAAARTLHVTPSGISQQLNKLEREVGVPLLEPQGRGVRLTEAGRILARRTAEVLSTLAQAEAEIASLQSEVTGRVRIGALVSPSRTVLPRAIAEIRHAHPQLEITFNEGESEELLPALIRRDLDVVVVDRLEHSARRTSRRTLLHARVRRRGAARSPGVTSAGGEQGRRAQRAVRACLGDVDPGNGLSHLHRQDPARAGVRPTNRVRGRRVSHPGRIRRSGPRRRIDSTSGESCTAGRCSNARHGSAARPRHLPRLADRQPKGRPSWRR